MWHHPLSAVSVCDSFPSSSTHPIHLSMTSFLTSHYNERNGVSNHRRIDCLFNRLFRSNKTPKFRVNGLCEGNPPVTDGFSSQRASNAENTSIQVDDVTMITLTPFFYAQYFPFDFLPLPGTGEFPAQMARNAENASIWWRHHGDMLENARISLC